MKMAGDGKLEKEPIRKAFEGLLPERILRRQKEQFSDGVGYLWIDTLKAQAEARVSDQGFGPSRVTLPHQSTNHQRGILVP